MSRLILVVLLFSMIGYGCSFSVFPKQDSQPVQPAPLTLSVPTAYQSPRCTDNAMTILDAAKKIDVVGDRAPKCPQPYELCFDHSNATKLRVKLKLLTGESDNPIAIDKPKQ